MNRRFTGVSILGAVMSLGLASIAGAQKALPDEPGFQPNRDYLALQPWEAIDTGSNNIILTFTDLALPGNAGRELRFDRVFSNQGPAPGERRSDRSGDSGSPACRCASWNSPCRPNLCQPALKPLTQSATPRRISQCWTGPA